MRTMLFMILCLIATSGVQAQIPQLERDALIALYNAADGPNWMDNSNWRLYDDSDFNTPGSECSWYGVTCDGGTNVTTLNLSSNWLTGTVPSEIGNLSSLVNLYLGSNWLGGEIPQELTTLSSLERLNLSANNLSGSIPSSIGSLANLQYLSMSSNGLSGAIPVGLGTLSNLEYLNLHHNDLGGEIPAALGDLAALTYLDLNSNDLTGSIPADIGNLGNLQNLYLSSNQLTGSIPVQLQNLSSLQYLYLDANMLRGSIPPEIADLPSFTYGQIGYNALYTDDPTLQAFLDSTMPTWSATQTIAPENVNAVAASSSSITVSWTPVSYTSEPGYYAVFAQPAPGGDLIFEEDFEDGDAVWWTFGNPCAVTATKATSSITVSNLAAGTNYSFVVRTVTNPHTLNLNRVISDASTPTNATTDP